MFIEWFLLTLLQCAFTIVCYITNPIVVLFADSKGELPPIFKWWQTHDNTLDIEWVISEEIVPKFLRYAFNKHYIYHYEEKGDGFMRAGYVDLIDPHFTLKERIQRYFCRLYWLYRNTAYGFAYNVCGRDFLLDKAIINYDYGKGNRGFYAKASNIWGYYLEKQYYKNFYVRVYLGWKIKGCLNYKHTNRAMIALFFSPFRKID